MEYLNFGGSYSQADLGRALAEMHKADPAVKPYTGVSEAQRSSLKASGTRHVKSSITEVM